MEGPHIFFQGVISLNELAAALIVEFPFSRRHQRTFGAIDQLYPESFFQLVHDLAGARLRYTVLVRSSREAALADNVAEHLEGLYMHERLT